MPRLTRLDGAGRRGCTREKPYPARAQNIATFISGRFTPHHNDLAEVGRGLEATEPEGLPTVMPLRQMYVPQRGLPTALLITDEDCRIEDFDLSGLDLHGTATLSCSHLRPVADAALVFVFETAALADAETRLSVSPMRLSATHPVILVEWAQEVGAKQIFTPFVTRGPLRDWLNRAEPILAERGTTFCEHRRDRDTAIWPHATAGFFKIRKHIPQILNKTVLA